MSETVRLIEKEEVIAWVKQGGVRGYRYEPNVRGSWFLIITAMIATALAVVLFLQSGLALLVHKAGFAVLVGYAMWASWIVGHWNLFAARNYVGMSDTELLVGRGSSGYVIPLSRLTRDTVRMEDMRRGSLTSVLPLEVGTFRRSIHLIGPYANMKNVQQFIAEILACLIGDEDEGVDPADGGVIDVDAGPDEGGGSEEDAGAERAR